jgi:hypothetical protein
MISEILSTPGIPELFAAESCFKVGRHLPVTEIARVTVIVDEVVSSQMEWTYFLAPAAAVTVIFVAVGRKDLPMGGFEDIG